LPQLAVISGSLQVASTDSRKGNEAAFKTPLAFLRADVG
jgi:hypothetical protein